MRICVPLLSRPVEAAASGESGVASRQSLPLAAHFGEANCFAVVDSESGAWLGECRVASHCPGACHCPLPDLADQPVDALVGRAAGFRLIQLSRRAGLPVLAVAARTLGELCREVGAGLPTRALPAPVCLSQRTGTRPRS